MAEVGSQASPLLVGIIAEGTAEVLDLAPADCADAQDFGDEMVPEYPLRIAKVTNRVKTPPKIDRVETSPGPAN